MFYASLLGEFNGSSFAYTVQNNKIPVGTKIWHDFGMHPLPYDVVQITDSCVLLGFEYCTTLNSMLKAPYPERVVNSTLFP